MLETLTNCVHCIVCHLAYDALPSFARSALQPDWALHLFAAKEAGNQHPIEVIWLNTTYPIWPVCRIKYF
jgi:hypothetical protein